MTKLRPINIACPFCKADPAQLCKSLEGHTMTYFHNQRTLRDLVNQPIIKATPIPKTAPPPR
jgi:hypothetical protein